jgi:hypothetical protein
MGFVVACAGRPLVWVVAHRAARRGSFIDQPLKLGHAHFLDAPHHRVGASGIGDVRTLNKVVRLVTLDNVTAEKA